MTSNVAIAPRAAAATPGCFFLPALDPEIPVLTGGFARQQVLARFAKASALAGVRLPKGNSFHSIEQIVNAQWNGYLRERFEGVPLAALAGAPKLIATDDTLAFVVYCESRLNVFRLKPVVEGLEQAKAGLGWFVEAVISESAAHGHPLYGMNMLHSLLDSCEYEMDEFTDEAFARVILLQESDTFTNKKEVTPQMIAELKEQYTFWPSDLLEAAGGHVHLLGGGYWGRPARPKELSSRAAKQWTAQRARGELTDIVELAVDLKRALGRDKGRAFSWFSERTRDDDATPLGAAAFIAWDDAQLLMEAVSHFEQMEQQGECEYAFARHVIPLSEADDLSLVQMATAAVAYFDRWALLAQLLSHFPTWED